MRFICRERYPSGTVGTEASEEDTPMGDAALRDTLSEMSTREHEDMYSGSIVFTHVIGRHLDWKQTQP